MALGLRGQAGGPCKSEDITGWGLRKSDFHICSFLVNYDGTMEWTKWTAKRCDGRLYALVSSYSVSITDTTIDSNYVK